MESQHFRENFTTSAPTIWKDGNGWCCPHPACGIRFTRKSDISRHMNAVHRQNKAFVCPFPGCDRLFSRRDNLLTHQRKFHQDSTTLRTLFSGHHSSRGGSSAKQVEKDTDINIASSRQESLPELGYESPCSENAKSDPPLLAKDWEAHRGRIVQLYQDLTLRNVMDVMKKTHGFQASSRQYKRKFSEWKLSRPVKKARIGPGGDGNFSQMSSITDAQLDLSRDCSTATEKGANNIHCETHIAPASFWVESDLSHWDYKRPNENNDRNVALTPFSDDSQGRQDTILSHDMPPSFGYVDSYFGSTVMEKPRIINENIQVDKAAIDQLNWRQDEQEQHQERRAIVDWLTPIDYSTQQSEFISRREEGTGRWLLNSNKFRQWVKQSRQTLFCPGMPGAGKTILTSIIVDHLFARFQDETNVGIAYLYCNFRRQHEQRPVDLLLGLLKQLIQDRPFIPENVKTLYEHYKGKRTRPSFNEILKELQSVMLSYTRTFVIIDALDECQVSNGVRSRFLFEIFSLQEKTRANLFATSRFIPEITKQFEGSVSLEIRANDEDVQRYLDGYMVELPSFVIRSHDLQEEIKTTIIKAVDGMFLLAQLHLGSLIGKISPKAIRIALKELPTGSEAYDHTYKKAMERIERQIGGRQKLARQVLSWITCTKRPLTTLELRHALAVEVDESELDKENLPEIEDIVSVCAGLVTVDKESDIIRLVHYTTQEYFERMWTFWFPNAHRDIATTCVTYLLFDAFETGFCQTDEEFEARLQLNPLYDYAARNWGHHVCAASIEVERLILDFLESETKVAGSSQAMMASRDSNYHGYSQRVSRQMTGLHIAACFGLREAMIALFKDEHDPVKARMPLLYAAENGHEAVVKLLLEKVADPDFKDTTFLRQTPLSLAVRNGHEAVVKLLLEKGADLGSNDVYGQTPLLYAAGNGHEAVVKLLLEKGADLKSKDVCSHTPLLYAAGNGHEAVVKLLLEKGADMESKDVDGRTPLLCAAENGHEAVVKLLLENGAELESKGVDGRTPLSFATENRQEGVVKLLLEKGAELESKGVDGRTPLSFASENGHEAVVKQLLEKGAEPESRDNYYSRTPLLWAVRDGHQAVIKLLLEKGADLETKDICGHTLLLYAVGNRYKAIVKLLLEKGADIKSKDVDGQTPLFYAIGNRHEAMVKQLLENGADLESKDINGRTPLLYAAGNGHEAVVKLLLEKGAEPESRDNYYSRTSLLWAVRDGHQAVVKLLLEKGADLETKDVDSRTSLLYAAGKGYEAVVKLLLENGADLESKDVDGRTPLLYAAGNGHEAVVKLLLKKGVDLESKDVDGRTPLLYAAGNGHEAVIKLLLEKGADQETKDVNGRTPLLYSAENGHEAVVKLLLEKGELSYRLYWAT